MRGLENDSFRGPSLENNVPGFLRVKGKLFLNFQPQVANATSRMGQSLYPLPGLRKKMLSIPSPVDNYKHLSGKIFAVVIVMVSDLRTPASYQDTVLLVPMRATRVPGQKHSRIQSAGEVPGNGMTLELRSVVKLPGTASTLSPELEIEPISKILLARYRSSRAFELSVSRYASIDEKYLLPQNFVQK